MARITFESNGYTLAGNLFKHVERSKNVAFLFIQGWTGEQNIAAAKTIAELGYATLTYDMRGNGNSEGKLGDFSRADFTLDAIRAYDYLRRHTSNTTMIGVIGNSFGSYISAILTTKRDVISLSLHVPANYPDARYDQPHLAQMTAERLEWRKKPLDYHQNRALKAIHDFKGKIQIIEDELDEIIARQTPQNYANAVASKSLLSYEVIPNALHTLETAEQQADYSNRLVQWILKSH